MRIDPATALQASLRALRTRREEAAPGFAPASDAAAPPAALSSAGSAAPTASIATLLAVAAAGGQGPRSTVLRRAERGLEALEELHRRLRSGGSPDAAIDELAQWQRGDEAAEGDAAPLMDEVELRILVELAKAGR